MTHRTKNSPGRTGLMRIPCTCDADHAELIAQRVTLNGDCWEWLLRLDRDGYGRAVHLKRTWQAHRFAYVSLVGEIPDGLVFDHLCRNRRCVNPDHLEPVTDRVNTSRIPTLRAHLARIQQIANRRRAARPITHGASAYSNRGCRCEVCKDGNAARQRAYQERRRASEAA